MSAELANESSQPHVRNAAGLALKNALTARVRQRAFILLLVGTRLTKNLRTFRRAHGKMSMQTDGCRQTQLRGTKSSENPLSVLARRLRKRAA
jgi:hypothetical protein